MVDLDTGQTLFSQAANTGRLPASVEKIYTTSTALLRLGPNATFTTSILGTGSRSADGVWDGNLYLRGGGDPTFGSVGFDQSWYGTGTATTMRTLIGNLLRATDITAVERPHRRGRVVLGLAPGDAGDRLRAQQRGRGRAERPRLRPRLHE